ncbi:hypothetical protein [Sporofaciens musculi]|jgi:hypothetical protein|uniref:hypothetical protein n=1 Tax=Sporofaciens musculi TaxID=2681861 RepID=UPI001FCBABC9|nr:hypothetical protein [Sporofaciens musculi]
MAEDRTVRVSPIGGQTAEVPLIGGRMAKVLRIGGRTVKVSAAEEQTDGRRTVRAATRGGQTAGVFRRIGERPVKKEPETDDGEEEKKERKTAW